MKKLATIQERLSAKLIDWALQAFPLFAFLSSFEMVVRRGQPGMSVVTPVASSLILLFAALMLMQWTLIAVRGQSFGKIIMRIKITDEKGKNVPSVWNVLFLRTLLNGVMLGNGLYFIMDAVMILRKEQRCIHDFIAGSIVVKTK